MKDFIKQTMAVVVGMVLVSIIMGVLTIVSMAGMIASEGMSLVGIDENQIPSAGQGGYDIQGAADVQMQL